MVSKRLWGPALIGCLVAGVLGVGGGGAAAQEPPTVTASIMVPAAQFSPVNYPAQNLYTFDPNGLSAVNAGHFLAWVPLPANTDVTLRNLRLFAFDNTDVTGWGVCLQVHRAAPPAASHELLASGAEACTAGGASSEDPQVIKISTFYGGSSGRLISTGKQALLLWVTMSPTTRFYGVQVNYSYLPPT